MDKLNKNEIKSRALQLRASYKASLQAPHAWEEDVSRVRHLFRKGAVLVDIGGGISAHNGVLAQMGMSVYVVDVLGDYWEHRDTDAASIAAEVKLLESCGARFIEREISTCDLTKYFADNSVDIVTSFHCIEHLHSSPKVPLESAMHVLKPGGTMIIEVPNAANLRKRLALLLGRTNYGPYNSLYYSDRFWGHIREYTTGDLQQLAANLGACTYRISGRNTIYGDWVERIPAMLRSAVDHSLRVLPGLCSALVLEITKAKQSGTDGQGAITEKVENVNCSSDK